MRTLLTVELDEGTVSIAIDETYLDEGFGEVWLFSDPIPLTADRANEIAKGLIDWAKEQTK